MARKAAYEAYPYQGDDVSIFDMNEEAAAPAEVTPTSSAATSHSFEVGTHPIARRLTAFRQELIHVIHTLSRGPIHHA